jgi:hypothetical protein
MATSTTITGAEIGLLSYLFEAVGDLLTDAQRKQLTDQLTSLRPAGVAPGDLITAELFNGMLNNLNDLMARVAVLEGAGGGPVITGILPADVDKEIGSRVTIVGRNFRPDAPDTVVNFGSIPVSDFLIESDEENLITQVPIGFASLPATINVTVKSGEKTSNSMPIRIIAPVVVPDGNVQVRNLENPLGQITIGPPFTMNWRLINNRNVPVSLTLAARLSEIDGATEQDWRNNIVISRPNPVEMDPGERLDLSMRVVVPANAVSALVGLDAVDNFDVIWRGNATEFIVGARPEQSDPNVSLVVPNFTSGPNLGRTSRPVDGISMPGYQIRPNVTVNLPMTLSTLADGAGFFEITATVEAGTPAGGVGPQTGRWTPGTLGTRIQAGATANVPFTIPLTSAPITPADITTISVLRVTARRFATATSTTEISKSFGKAPIIGKT